tara:strand:+ start:16578 stop:17612 length:1035 start_codon:yes stop_codon:yes gene_type:complete
MGLGHCDAVPWDFQSWFAPFMLVDAGPMAAQHPAQMSTPVIQTQSLTKQYGPQLALSDVSLAVPPGAVGLLGPNGAGKTTLIKCLLQLVPHTRGQAELLGRDVTREGRETRKRVGYAPEQDCHIPGMVGCEYVTYCAQLNGLPFQAARQRAHEMLDFVGMGQERYREVDTYSTGMKQRVKLAQAIVHDPELVFLDEPTNGLDPAGREQILQLVQNLWREHGMTVVLSSHLLHDVDRICDQIIIIARGQVMVHDTLKNLKQRKIGIAEVVLAAGQSELQTLLTGEGMPAEVLSNGHVRVELPGDDIAPVLHLLHAHGIRPLEIIPSPNALEEIFVQALAGSHDAN